MKDLIEFFGSLFQDYLVQKCADFRRKGIHLQDIQKIATEMFNEHLDAYMPENRTNWHALELKELDTVAHRSFPPCMYRMYRELKEKGHLYHQGRLQLGLFLKGIGLSLRDSLEFWQTAFSKRHGLDEFEKKYAYNIKYNYGQVGAGRHLTPYSCVGMNRVPVAGDLVHGCPLRLLSEEGSLAVLREMGKNYKNRNNRTPPAFDQKLAAIAEKGQTAPDVACRELFCLLHDGEEIDPFFTVTHPKRYYDESEQIFEKLEKK
jgi:DNA primase large subunit